MLKAIALVAALLVCGVLIFAASRPDTFRIERSAAIAAPPETVFALINDFRRWEAWSPWEKKDPAMKRRFGAATAGTGATYAWDGNKEVGQGSMAITESTAPSRIELKLDFVRPFETHNVVEFTLAREGAGTRVTWAMHGPSNFLSKLIQVFVSMDAMVGKDFEAGLAAMKAAAER